MLLKNDILNDEIENFNNYIENLIEGDETKHRKETILAKQDYILNHFKAIKLTHTNYLSCSMEAHISHNVASLFASRPKGYSPKYFNKRLFLRMLATNNYDVKQLCLYQLDKGEQVFFEQKVLDFSMFEKPLPPKVIISESTIFNTSLTYDYLPI